MENSFKGAWVTTVLVSVFVISIVMFIIQFPIEQGFELNSENNETYYTLRSISNDYIPENINITQEDLNEGYDNWDIEVGFMGSNTLKKGKTNMFSYIGQTINNVKIMARELFSTSDGSTHPIIWVLGVLAGLFGVYVTYLIIKFIRTGT